MCNRILYATGFSMINSNFHGLGILLYIGFLSDWISARTKESYRVCENCEGELPFIHLNLTEQPPYVKHCVRC